MTKTSGKKSRDTVPLRTLSLLYNMHLKMLKNFNLLNCLWEVLTKRHTDNICVLQHKINFTFSLRYKSVKKRRSNYVWALRRTLPLLILFK
jgi:hypothetical protein